MSKNYLLSAPHTYSSCFEVFPVRAPPRGPSITVRLAQHLLTISFFFRTLPRIWHAAEHMLVGVM